MKMIITVVYGYLTPIDIAIRSGYLTKEVPIPEGVDLSSFVDKEIGQVKEVTGRQILSVCHSFIP